MKRTSGFLLGALTLAVALPCVVFGSERVTMQSPAKDAAYVSLLPGMVNNHKLKSYLGTAHTANDGIVIRQSYIKDGKIVIPPGGLYVTSRSGNWEPFAGKPLTIAGKEYVAINNISERTVIRNVTFKKNQVIPVDKNRTRGFELTSIDPLPYYLPGQGTATFKLLKATGNYYGAEFPAYAGDLITNVADSNWSKGTKEKEGITAPTAENGIGEALYASSFSGVGRSYVVVESITADEVKVLELATDNSVCLYVSPDRPQVKDVVKGDSFTIAGGVVDVLDVTADSVKIRLKDARGSVEKVLGPYNRERMKWVPLSTPACAPFWALSKGQDVAVHMNVFKDGGPIRAGKASLVAYSGVMGLRNSAAWAADPRFLSIPET